MHIIDDESPYCFLTSKVMPSQQVSGATHKPWVCVEKKSGAIYCAHCSCMAGLGETCSHIAAVLFKIEIGVRLGLSTVSSTSEACRWNKAFREEVQPNAIDEVKDLFKGNHKTIPKSNNPSGSDALPAEDQLHSLKEICPEACLFSIIPKLENEETDSASEEEDQGIFPPLLSSLYEQPFADLEGDELEQYQKRVWNRYHVSDLQLQALEKQTRSQSVSELWHKHRQGRITVSKVHDVVCALPSTDPSKLVARIMGYSSYDLTNIPAVKYGITNEYVAREWYSSEMDSVHQNFSCRESGFFISKSYPFAGASPDGIVSCSCYGKRVLEIKVSFENKEKSVQEAANEDGNFCLNSDLLLKKSHRYYSQVQFQMLVLEVLYCDFVICTDIDKHRHRINLDRNFSGDLITLCKSFFFDNVLPEILTKRIILKQEDQSVSEGDVCLCRKKAYGKMVACSGANCEINIFHYRCMNIKRKPRKDWFCPSCS